MPGAGIQLSNAGQSLCSPVFLISSDGVTGWELICDPNTNLTRLYVTLDFFSPLLCSKLCIWSPCLCVCLMLAYCKFSRVHAHPCPWVLHNLPISVWCMASGRYLNWDYVCDIPCWDFLSSWGFFPGFLSGSDSLDKCSKRECALWLGPGLCHWLNSEIRKRCDPYMN